MQDTKQFPTAKSFPLQNAKEEIKDEMATSRNDKTAIPNWLMGFIILAFFSLLGFVYSTVDRQIGKLEMRIQTQETYMKNTREKLIEHGWSIDDNGNIYPPKKELKK